MRKILLLSFFCTCFISAKSQFFHKYLPGYYYDNSGRKFSGLIELIPVKESFLFKMNKDASSERIKIEDVSSVITSDSLVVATLDGDAKDRYFAKPALKTINGGVYFRFRFVQGGGGPTMRLTPTMSSGGTVSHSYTLNNSPAISLGLVYVPMYIDGNTTREITRKNYVEILSKILADDSELVKQLQDKTIKYRDVNYAIEQYILKHNK